MKVLSIFLALLGIAITAVSAFIDSHSFNGVFNSISWWSYSPFIGMGFFSWLAKNSVSQWTALFIVIGLFGVSAYGHISNHLHPDAQGALIYVFLPVCQWLAVATIIMGRYLIGFFLSWRSKHK